MRTGKDHFGGSTFEGETLLKDKGVRDSVMRSQRYTLATVTRRIQGCIEDQASYYFSSDAQWIVETTRSKIRESHIVAPAGHTECVDPEASE